jgi:hypothetical protein
MATITSVTNFSGSKQWTDPTAWQGGVVPVAADIAQIRGIRTTINQAAFNYWPTTATITVASTAGFPATGSFYTATERSQKIKINYQGTSSTQFQNCTVDTAYFPWTTSITTTPWSASTPTFGNFVTGSPFFSIYGGAVPNGTYVHYSNNIIELTGSVSAYQVIIENGGTFKMYDSGTLFAGTSSAALGGGIFIRDGLFHISESGNIIWNTNNTGASTGEISRIYCDNFQLSRTIFEGKETRTNTTLTATASIGDGKLAVSSTSGFGVGDYIIVKDPNFNLYRIDDGFRVSFATPSGSYDEVFQVAGISGNDLYVSRRNAIKGPILTIPASNQIVVDATQFNIGDKIVANNQVYTVVTASDYDHLLKDYDFTQAGTTLADWETNVTRSAFFADWAKSASPVSGSSYALTQWNTTAYRHLVVKDIMRQEVKVEAWISNYRGVTSGTNDGGALGVIIHSDPIMDGDFGYDSFARTYFEVDRDNGRYRLLQRAVSSDSTIVASRAGVPVDFLRKYTLECRRGVINGYINDTLVNSSIMRSGGYYGRVGVHCTAQNSFTCTQFKVYATAQLLTLDRAYTGSIGNTVYESGCEFTHGIGNQVVKQAAIIIPSGSFNLAYGYRGASNVENNNIYPYMYGAYTGTPGSTRTTSTAFYALLNGNSNYDYPSTYNFGNNVTGSMIVDLTTPQTFTHVTFNERFSTSQQFWTGSQFSIQTSNNLATFTAVPLRTGSTGTFATASSDGRRRYSGDSVRSFELQTPQTARYIRFVKNGNTTGNSTTNTENRWMNIGIRNYSDGFKIKLSSVADYNVGDEIMIMYNGGYQSALYEGDFYTNIINNSVPTSSWTNDLKDYYTITAVDAVNNTVTLDRPYTHNSTLIGGERVMKLNRPIKMFGLYGSGSWRGGRWNVAAGGATLGRVVKLKNAEWNNMTANFPTNRASDYQYSAFGHRNYSIWEADIYDGVTYYNSFNTATSFTGYLAFSGGSTIVRDSYWGGWSGRGWRIYFPSQYCASYNAGNTYFACLWNENVAIGSIFNFYNNYNSTYTVQSGNRLMPQLTFFYTSNVFTPPYIAQYRRNYNNGGNYAGWMNTIHQGNGYVIIMDWADNLFEYTEDYITENYRHLPYWHNQVLIPTQGNTWNRLTRFRNEGFISPTREMSNQMFSPHFQNYMRWNYNMTYNDYNYITKNPSESFSRVYRVNTIWQNSLFGTSFYLQNSSSATFNYSFEYRHDKSQFALNANTYTGSLAQFVLRNGARYISDVVFPKVTGSFAFRTGSITVTGPGAFNIGIGQAALSGYVDIQNMRASFTSTDPANFQILNNNFDLAQIESPYNSSYRTGQYIINIDLT